MDDRRHPRRDFDAALVREFIGNREIATVTLLPSGKSNTNYEVLLSDGERCVLRLCQRAGRESYVMRLVRDVVPVPEVLDYGDDWMLLSFVKGEHLATVPTAAVPNATRAAATILARIASFEFACAGWIEGDGTVTPFNFGAGQDFVSSMLKRTDIQSWLGSDTVATIHRINEREAQCALDLQERICLSHGDFNPTNILIYENAVSAILDWEFTHAGSSYMDIANLLRHTDPAYHSAIEAGLKDGGMQLTKDWQLRAEWVDVSSHLEFLTTARCDEFKEQCVHWIQKFIKKYHHGC